MRTRSGFGILISVALSAGAAPAQEPLAACLASRNLPRVGRVADAAGQVRFVKFVADVDGVPTAFVPLAADDLSEALMLAAKPTNAAEETLSDEMSVLSPIDLSTAAIDTHRSVVVAAGLNYAAHAEEAGGGDVFLFPKPVEPSGPYAPVPVHPGVSLLDYEVELAFVLLRDIRLSALPTRRQLLSQVAFFVSNDISDREPIIRRKGFSGYGTGFVEGKGRPGYLPAGPWVVRGLELFAAIEKCGEDSLGIRLEVDQGDGFVVRQSSSTARMILGPYELLERIHAEVVSNGLRTSMSVERDGETRYYPLAVDSEDPRLPAGSVVVTGTPDGVALQAPSVLPLVLRGLASARGPIEQFRVEQLERARAALPGGYLKRGDRVRASIDGLGTQLFRVGGENTK